MAYYHFRNARAIDGNTLGLYNNDLTKILQLDDATANVIKLKGGSATSTDDLMIYANTTDAYPYFILYGLGGVNLRLAGGYSFEVREADTIMHKFGSGAMQFRETTTPSAIGDLGAIYTKNDNKLYFQSGDGVEHTVAFV